MEGTCFESDWAAVAAGSSALRPLLGRLHQAGSDRLGPMFAELDELKMLAEAGQVGLLDEGLSRGDVRDSDAASPAGWVRQWGPSYRAGGAAALVEVTEAVAQERQRGAARGGPGRAGAGAQRGRRVGRDGQAAAPADPGVPGTVLDGFVAMAEGQGPREIRALRPAVIARYGRLGEFQRREDRLKHGPSLSQPYDDDGMAEYRLRLDPEGSAVLEAILGPLAAPQPSHRARLGPAHQRPAPRRRAGRGLPPRRRRGRVRADHGQGGGGRHDGLPGPDGPDRGGDDADRGAARPRDGPEDGLRRRDHPGRARLRGEVLDLGRTVRLATPKQVQALWIRDRGAPSPAARGPPPGASWSCPDPVDGYVLMLAYWIGVR